MYRLTHKRQKLPNLMAPSQNYENFVALFYSQGISDFLLKLEITNC